MYILCIIFDLFVKFVQVLIHHHNFVTIADSSCTQDVSPYLPTLPASTNCRISSGCTVIQCCTDLPLIGRTLNYKININACSHTLVLQIETFQLQLSPLDFEFGEEQTFSIDQIFSIKYV
jgi:hypothetical protein